MKNMVTKKRLMPDSINHKVQFGYSEEKVIQQEFAPFFHGQLLAEWKLENYQLAFPPHRLISSLLKLDFSLKLSEETPLNISELGDTIAYLSRYVSAAFSTTDAVYSTLTEEIELLNAFLRHKKTNDDSISLNFQIENNIEINEVSEPRIPSMIILPYLNTLLRGVRSNDKTISFQVKIQAAQNKTGNEDQEWLECEIHSNTFYNLRKDCYIWNEPFLIGKRQEMLSLLLGGITWHEKISGDQAYNRFELEAIQKKNAEIYSHIVLTIPILSTQQRATLDGQEPAFYVEAA